MKRSSIFSASFCAATLLFGAGGTGLRAQSNGPLRPPPPSMPRPTAPSKPEAPPIPVEEIIKRFAAKEDEMLRASLGYGFEKSVRLEEIGPDGKPAGQVEIISQLMAGPDGKRYEKIVRRTESTLHYLQMERGDLNVIDSAPLFPLTSGQVSKYEFTYQGTQPLDELNVYIFGVKPRALDRAYAYFSGVIWVDQQDMAIVKTIGKWISENGDVTSTTLPFAVFETYRQPVGKSEWFPADSRSDASVLEGDIRVPIRMIIRWRDYKLMTVPIPAPTPPTDVPLPGSAKP